MALNSIRKLIRHVIGRVTRTSLGYDYGIFPEFLPVAGTLPGHNVCNPWQNITKVVLLSDPEEAVQSLQSVFGGISCITACHSDFIIETSKNSHSYRY